MFARILEITTKKGQARALCRAIEQKGLPLLGKYPGFVDEVHLISEEVPDTIFAISFWQDREAAEKYRNESYSAIAGIYRPFLEGGIRVCGYDVPVALTFKAKRGVA